MKKYPYQSTCNRIQLSLWSWYKLSLFRMSQDVTTFCPMYTVIDDLNTESIITVLSRPGTHFYPSAQPFLKCEQLYSLQGSCNCVKKSHFMATYIQLTRQIEGYMLMYFSGHNFQLVCNVMVCLFYCTLLASPCS